MSSDVILIKSIYDIEDLVGQICIDTRTGYVYRIIDYIPNVEIFSTEEDSIVFVY